MSCTNCNKSNCSCSDNCPTKVSDITVFDCNNFNVIDIPCDASLCDVLGLLEAYTTNMVNELSEMTSVVIGAENCIGLEPGTYSIQQVIDAINVIICNIPETVVEAGDGISLESEVVGNVTTYTISTLGAMRAQSAPSNLLVVSPSSSVNLYTNGTTQLMSEIYDDDNAYDPVTGIWTCPATGRYDLSFFVHLTNTSFSSGMIIAGITAANSNNFYCVNSVTFNQANRHADIAGTALGMNINAGTQLVLKVLNTSNVSYTSDNSDVARLVIQRAR